MTRLASQWMLFTCLILVLLSTPVFAVNSLPSSQPQAFTQEEFARLNRARQELQSYMSKVENVYSRGRLHHLLELLDRVIAGQVSPAYFRMEMYQKMQQAKMYASSRAVQEESKRTEYEKQYMALYKLMTGLKQQTLPQTVSDARDVTISTGMIKKIYINARHGGMGSQYVFLYELNNTGRYFQGSRGHRIPREQIESLQQSLTGLRLWTEELSCAQVTDKWENIEFEIEFFDTADRLFINSHSTCVENAPWNVIWRGNVYLHFHGPLHEQISKLLADLENHYFINYAKNRYQYNDEYSFRISFTPLSQDSTISRSDQAQEDLLQILHRAPVFHPYLLNNSVTRFMPTCMLRLSNLDCRELLVNVNLLSHDQNIVQQVPVLIRGDEIIKVFAPADEVIRAATSGGPRQYINYSHYAKEYTSGY